MRKFLPLLMALAVLWPAAAQAQPQRGRDRGDRRERIGRVIADCEERTNAFLTAVQRAWGRESHSEDELDRNAAKLERALNRIRDGWNRDHDYNRTRANVGAALEAGRQINRTLARHRMRTRVADEWQAIRSELNNLAEVFEQPPIKW